MRHAVRAAAGVAVAGLAGAVVLALVSDRYRPNAAIAAAACIASLACVAVGLLIDTRRDGHPMGRLLVANGLLAASWAFADSWARHALLDDPGSLPGGRWAVLWSDGSWPLLILVLTWMALLFPGGALREARERRLLGVALASAALLLALGVTADEELPEPFSWVDRPVPSAPGAFAVLWPVAMLGALTALVASMRVLRVRFRHARGVEREQLRWLAYAAVLIPLLMILPLASSLLGLGEISDSTPFEAAVSFVFGVVPATVGLAILRYRLYDIDRIVSRTLVYLSLTAILGATYAGGVLLLQLALSPSSDLAIAGSTLAVAALFGPLRARVQSIVDRRFFRRRYDARATLQAFGARVRDQVSLEAVEAELCATVSEAMQPAHLRVWLRREA